jgi:Fic/DOC family
MRGRPSRQAIFDRLDRAVGELWNVGGLPHPVEAEEIWEGIWFEETHHSTAIEGNTLILKEVKTLLEEGRAVGAKELREYLEVQGYAEAAQWVYQQALRGGPWVTGDLITLPELREIHRLTIEPVWKHFPPPAQDSRESPGSFRRHDIEPFTAGMRPPPWPDVPPLITDWLAAANALHAYVEQWMTSGMPLTDPTDHPLAHLAAHHAAFERIHPFRDGNGRAGRLALNLMLVRLGYPPAIIYKKDRLKYLEGLNRADKGDPCALGELLARAVKYGIDRFLLPALAGPQRIIPLSALTDQDLSLIALRRAAERGRLRALRRSDQWYSTRKWVDEYKRSRHRGRRRVVKERGSPSETNPQQRLPVF